MTTQQRRKAGSDLFSTDRLAVKLYTSLLRDFRVFEGKDFCAAEAESFAKGPHSFRLEAESNLGEVPPLYWKRKRQMENLLKKYRFANDIYSDEDLEDRTINAYLDTQVRICSKTVPKYRTSLVLQRARRIARRILGKFDSEEVLANAKFGKRSSIGCPMSLAYIDVKLSDIKAFTGSSKCAEWFYSNVLKDDAILSRIIARLPNGGRDGDLQHETLNLVNVPKTWKTFRTITPLTLLSLFYSYGVGIMVADRLKDAGLDIAKLQHRHSKLVKRFSVSKSHATADLSAASDSILSEHLNRILPREWYVALKPIMTHQVRYKGGSYYTDSVLPMGNGCTFPVETLYFYCIIKAIGELTKTDGIYSVYGDDLIYPSSIHSYVYHVFADMSLVLNTDKTFVSIPFRESCGSDYYRGIDVRSFYFKGEGSFLTTQSYKMLLYKTFNGLLRRWDRNEIPVTIRMLLIELSLLDSDVYRVPPGFPDSAGIKCDEWDLLNPIDSLVPWSPVRILFSNGSRWYEFTFLDERPKQRAIICQEPYYWLSLAGRTDDPEVHRSFWERDLSVYSEAARAPITWRTVKRQRKYRTNSGVMKSRLIRKLKPFVASRTTYQARPKLTRAGSISDWI